MQRQAVHHVVAHKFSIGELGGVSYVSCDQVTVYQACVTRAIILVSQDIDSEVTVFTQAHAGHYMLDRDCTLRLLFTTLPMSSHD